MPSGPTLRALPLWRCGCGSLFSDPELAAAHTRPGEDPGRQPGSVAMVRRTSSQAGCETITG